jgi:hypothetical protein
MSEKDFFKENNGHARMPACPHARLPVIKWGGPSK